MRSIIKTNNFSTTLISLAMWLLLHSTASAETYGVQIGAFGKVPPEFIRKMEAFAPVHLERDTKITRVILGGYATKAEAQVLMNTLRDNGHTSGYVRRLSKSTSPVANTQVTDTRVKPSKPLANTSHSTQKLKEVSDSFWTNQSILPVNKPASRKLRTPTTKHSAAKLEKKPSFDKTVTTAKQSVNKHKDNHGDASHTHFTAGEAIKWENLTDEQRRNTVYLNGELHIKNGSNFILIK